MAEEKALIITDEFKARIKAFKKDFYQKYKDISKEKTPQVDGAGRKIIDRRPDGRDYIIEPWMRERLDKHFPGWSSIMAAPLQFLGAEWVVAQVELSIIDEHLLAVGVNSPIRKFYSVDAVRIQYKSGQPHSPENIIDVGDNCQAAVTGALKRAINRLTHIGDDVYGKRIEEEGAGSLEDVLATTLDSSVAATAFNELVKKKHLPWSKVFEILSVKSMAEIKDFTVAYNKLKEVLG